MCAHVFGGWFRSCLLFFYYKIQITAKILCGIQLILNSANTNVCNIIYLPIFRQIFLLGQNMNENKLFQDDLNDENFFSQSHWGTRTTAYTFLQHCKLSLIYHSASWYCKWSKFLKFLSTAEAATSVYCKAFNKDRDESILYGVMKFWSNSGPLLKLRLHQFTKIEDRATDIYHSQWKTCRIS